MSQRHLCAGAAVLFALVSFIGKAEATTITFEAAAIDGTHAPDEPGFQNGEGFWVYAGTPGNEGVFTTQGYRFTAQTNSNQDEGDHGLGTVFDPSVLPGVVVGDGNWLLTGGIVQMTQVDGGGFSLLNFQAAEVDPADDTVGQLIRVFGFKSGVFFQGLHFNLNPGPGFQTFVLPSSWTGLSSVNFSGRLTDIDGLPRVAGIDNINVTTVP